MSRKQRGPRLSDDELLLQAEEIARSAGTRFTDIRRHVYAELLRSDQPVGAYEILPSLEGIGAAKPPTIYRALDWLHDLGLIRKIANNSKYTALRSGTADDPVAFVVCRECGQASELAVSGDITSLFSDASSQGYSDFKSTLELSGKCVDCE